MSIKIKGLHKDADYLKDDISKIKDDFKKLLISHYNDEIILTDKLINKGYRLIGTYKDLQESLIKYNNLADEIKISSSVRTLKTHLQIYKHLNKNRKVELTPPKTSQHLHWEALDLHFYKDGKRIEGKDLNPIYNLLCNLFALDFLQILSYSWGIHIGLATSRAVVSRSRRRP